MAVAYNAAVVVDTGATGKTAAGIAAPAKGSG